MKRTPALFCSLILAAVAIGLAEDKADLAAIYKIKDEGLNRSQAMEIVSFPTDVYGPRLPAPPGERKAGEWVENRMREWGLGNVHTEDYEFGRSWELKHFSEHQIQPVYAPLIAYPKSWTPGTDGAVRAGSVVPR